MSQQFHTSTDFQDFAVQAGSPSYTVAKLPTSGIGIGAIVFASNGRKSGEGAAAGTGVPVWWNGINWKTFYDNSTVAA